LHDDDKKISMLNTYALKETLGLDFRANLGETDGLGNGPYLSEPEGPPPLSETFKSYFEVAPHNPVSNKKSREVV